MQKVLILFFGAFFLFQIKTYSQSQMQWAPPGAIWYYSYNNFAVQGYVKIEPIGDSLIAGKNTRILQKKIYWYDFILTQFDSTDLGLEFTYLDSNIVYYYRYGQFYTLYDFNADTSDFWQVAGWDPLAPIQICDSIGEIQVDSVSDIIINADTLKRLIVSPKDTSHWYLAGDVIEKVGAFSYMFPEPYFTCVVDVFEGGFLRCYSDSTIGLYQVSASPCDFIVGVEEMSTILPLSLYPNPANDYFTISAKGLEWKNTEIILYNPLGQMELSQKVTQPGNTEYSLDISKLPVGVYQLVVTEEDRRYVGRVLVE